MRLVRWGRVRTTFDVRESVKVPIEGKALLVGLLSAGIEGATGTVSTDVAEEDEEARDFTRPGGELLGEGSV